MAKKGKVIFVAFSDIQIEDWKRFSDNHGRLEDNGRILMKVRDLCLKYNCDALFCGDLFDDPKSIKNYTLQRAVDWLNSFKKYRIKIFAVDGNHDQSEKNSAKHRSPNYIKTFSSIYSNIIDLGFNTMVHKGIYLHGIPYLTDNRDFIKSVQDIKSRVKLGQGSKHILMIHTDVPGANEPNGREVSHQNIPTDIYKLVEGFDLVLSGHIHKPQKLYGNIYMLGATHQQRVSDAGCEMGAWLVYDSMTLEFVPLGMPEFIYIKEGKKIPEDGNFYIEVPKEVELEEGNTLTFKSTYSPDKLVKNYFEQKGIKSKSKRELLTKYLTDARN